MLKTKPKTWATLILRGEELSPDHITKILEITPDFMIPANIKNLQEKNSKPHWQLNSTLSPDMNLEEHIFAILKKLSQKRTEFREITQECECILYASVEFASMETDGICLKPRTLLLLGDLGVSLEFLPWLNES
jgi:REP element-mobilizing transposase RayT